MINTVRYCNARVVFFPLLMFLSMVDFDRFTAITVPNLHLKIRQLCIPVFLNFCMRGLLLSSFFSQLFINFL